MSRRCLCSRLLAAVEGDPRLRTLPLAVRMLFLLVAEAAARSPEVGVLPFASPARVSLLVSCPETDAETALETLAAETLIRIEAGRIAVPLVQDAADRAAVARRNGAAGGRPRKGETAQAARERRQGTLLLPIGAPGGDRAAKPGETQDAKPATPVLTTTSTSEVSRSGAVPPAREPAGDWISLGQAVADAAGLDGARGGFDYRPVQAWLNAGHDADGILGAVRLVAARPSYDPRAVKSLRYFDRAVEQHAASARSTAGPGFVPAPAPRSAEDRARERAEMEAIEARIAKACGWLPVSAYAVPRGAAA